jgi:hypothetical protein
MALKRSYSSKFAGKEAAECSKKDSQMPNKNIFEN